MSNENNMVDNPRNWPDPTRPGVPLNPERPDWHWVNGRPELWASDTAGGWWVISGNSYGAREMTSSRYGGPCFTSSEIATLVEKARREDSVSVSDLHNLLARVVAVKARHERDSICCGELNDDGDCTAPNCLYGNVQHALHDSAALIVLLTETRGR